MGIPAKYTSTIDRHALILSFATLNGTRAAISGIRNEFATVTQISTGLACEFAWATVERIVKSGGNFKS